MSSEQREPSVPSRPRVIMTLDEVQACIAADREAAKRGEPGLGANGLFCRRCGGDIVEVDNPFRREYRHRRGQECAPSASAGSER